MTGRKWEYEMAKKNGWFNAHASISLCLLLFDSGEDINE